MSKKSKKPEDVVMFGVRLPKSLVKKIKLEVAERGIKIKDFAVMAFEEYLRRGK